MKNFLKKYFLPHTGNDYRPHLFRGAGLIGTFCLIIIIFAFSTLGSIVIRRTDLTALVLPKVLVDYANSDRKSENFNNLAISPVLEKAAQLKADDMASKSYFAHQSPEGHSPWYWFLQVGYDFSFAGENLAVNFVDSTDVNTAWMNSPSHKENIMNSNFTEIGVATSEGNYGGRKTIFVVQLFGRPALHQSVEISPVVKANTVVNVLNKNASKVLGTTSLVTTKASSSVLGASGENNLYIAVEKVSASKSNITTSANYSNFLEKIFSSPRKILSVLYFIISIIIIVGLALVVAVEIKRQNPLHILFALTLLILMIVLLYVYQSLIFGQLLIL